jgi:hypothetical protein
MSCVLRMSAIEQSGLGLRPYRIDRGTLHFQVSKAEFEDFEGQMADAIAFLRSNHDQLRASMASSASTGVLDFAVVWRDAMFQSNRFTAELVREAGRLGLSLELSHYPQAEASNAEA